MIHISQPKISKKENLVIYIHTLIPIVNETFVHLFNTGIRPIGVSDDISMGEVSISDKPFFHIWASTWFFGTTPLVHNCVLFINQLLIAVITSWSPSGNRIVVVLEERSC